MCSIRQIPRRCHETLPSAHAAADDTGRAKCLGPEIRSRVLRFARFWVDRYNCLVVIAPSMNQKFQFVNRVVQKTAFVFNPLSPGRNIARRRGGVYHRAVNVRLP